MAHFTSLFPRLCPVILLIGSGLLFQATAQEVRLPAAVTEFTMTDSSRYDRAELGIIYTFTTADGIRANAYVYPVSPDRLRLSPNLRVAQEAKTFLATLAHAVEQGWYDDANIIVTEPRRFETAEGERPGHLVAAVLLRSDEAHVSFMHLITFGDQYIKTRLTLPHRHWQDSTAPNFGPELFRTISQPAPTAPGA